MFRTVPVFILLTCTTN